VNRAFVAANRVNTAEDFIERARENKFEPSRDMNNEAVLKGKADETWWFPSSAANAANLEKLREQLYIHQDVNYTHGAVRLDMPPAELKAAGIEMFKPTSFDGMMQGWEGDAWWKHSQDPHWGLTKNNTYEAVMKAMTLKHFKQRTLVMPTAPAAPKQGANGPTDGAHGAAVNNSGANKHA
jgi:hypothetical protein